MTAFEQKSSLDLTVWEKAEEESCQCTFWPSDAYPLGFLTSRTPKETTLNSLFFFAPRSNELLPLMHIAQEKKSKVSGSQSPTHLMSFIQLFFVLKIQCYEKR